LLAKFKVTCSLNDYMNEFMTTYSVGYSSIIVIEDRIVGLQSVLALLVGHGTCRLLVADLSPALAPLRTGLIRQATYTYIMPLSPS